jgi:hypothetical protein
MQRNPVGRRCVFQRQELQLYPITFEPVTAWEAMQSLGMWLGVRWADAPCQRGGGEGHNNTCIYQQMAEPNFEATHRVNFKGTTAMATAAGYTHPLLKETHWL